MNNFPIGKFGTRSGEIMHGFSRITVHGQIEIRQDKSVIVSGFSISNDFSINGSDWTLTDAWDFSESSQNGLNWKIFLERHSDVGLSSLICFIPGGLVFGK